MGSVVTCFFATRSKGQNQAQMPFIGRRRRAVIPLALLNTLSAQHSSLSRTQYTGRGHLRFMTQRRRGSYFCVWILCFA